MTALAQAAIAARLSPGDSAIDATMGNGHDTLFLAKQVGFAGRVWSFDIQPEALVETRRLLDESGEMPWVNLVLKGHESMDQIIPAAAHRRIKAIMFNLGYRPGGDHTLITESVTTRQALLVAAQLLSPQGIISVVYYPGHDDGAESRHLSQWFLDKHCPLRILEAIPPPVTRKPSPGLWLLNTI
jgi:hypothetical protein